MSTFTKTSGEPVDKTGEVIAQLLKDAQQSVASGDGSGALQKALLAMRLNTKGDEGEMMKILEQAKGSALKAREEAMKDFGLTSEEEAAKVASRAAMEVVGMTPADDAAKKPKKKKKKKKKGKGKKTPDEAVTNESGLAQKTLGADETINVSKQCNTVNIDASVTSSYNTNDVGNRVNLWFQRISCFGYQQTTEYFVCFLLFPTQRFVVIVIYTSTLIEGSFYNRCCSNRLYDSLLLLVKVCSILSVSIVLNLRTLKEF